MGPKPHGNDAAADPALPAINRKPFTLKLYYADHFVLPLPEGQWALRWTYWPDAVNWGAVISLLTAVMVFGRRPRAKEKPVSDFSAAPQSSA